MIILIITTCPIKMNPYRGWEIYEKGIYDILTNTRENYGNIKCYISENGMGSKEKNDLLTAKELLKMITGSSLLRII